MTEWRQAGRGGLAEIGELVRRLRDYLAGSEQAQPHLRPPSRDRPNTFPLACPRSLMGRARAGAPARGRPGRRPPPTAAPRTAASARRCRPPAGFNDRAGPAMTIGRQRRPGDAVVIGGVHSSVVPTLLSAALRAPGDRVVGALLLLPRPAVTASWAPCCCPKYAVGALLLAAVVRGWRRTRLRTAATRRCGGRPGR